MNLAETQRLFWRAITHPTGIEGFLADADASTRAAFASTFTGTDRFPAIERMNVYADAYYWRLHQTLAEMFPVVEWQLGPVRFRNLLTDYVLRRPSRDPDLRQIGGPLVPFLAEHAMGLERPHLASVARAEWAMVEVLDLADEAVASPADLAGRPVEVWPALELRGSGTIRLFASEWSFSDMWRSFRRGEGPGQAPLDPRPGFDLVWRQDRQVYHRRLDAAEGAGLRRVVAGTSFEDLCATAAAAGAGPEVVVAWLQRWLGEGLILRVD